MEKLAIPTRPAMGRDIVKYRRPRLAVPTRSALSRPSTTPQLSLRTAAPASYQGYSIDGMRHPKQLASAASLPVKMPMRSVVVPPLSIDVHSFHEQIVRQAEADGIYRPESRLRRVFRAIKPQYVMAGLVFAVGLGVSIQGMLVNHQAEQQVQVLAATTTAPENSEQAKPEVPSEEKPHPATAQKYTVAPDLPRFITIPSLNVSARVLQVGVNKNNELSVPGNVFDAAWYSGSNRPGEPGAMLIDGHVSGPTQKGVFYTLKNLKTGDTITVERGDGQKFSYAVRHIETVKVENVDMAKLLVPFELGKQGLNLITCGGKFDPKTSHFSDRVLVYATAI